MHVCTYLGRTFALFDDTQGNQMSVWKNHPKCRQTHFFQFNAKVLPWNKVDQEFGLLLQLSLPKVDNRPIGEKSPNLVNLDDSNYRKYFRWERQWDQVQGHSDEKLKATGFLLGTQQEPRTGWPDWANFRLLGDCLLLVAFWKWKK
jgi:hypothetical protein